MAAALYFDPGDLSVQQNPTTAKYLTASATTTGGIRRDGERPDRDGMFKRAEAPAKIIFGAAAVAGAHGRNEESCRGAGGGQSPLPHCVGDVTRCRGDQDGRSDRVGAPGCADLIAVVQARRLRDEGWESTSRR
jgi:hypothetical protein